MGSSSTIYDRVSASSMNTLVNEIEYRRIGALDFSYLCSSTTVKTYREDKKLPPPPEPKPMASVGPEIDDLKKDIIDEIKNHFDSCNFHSNL